MKRTAAILALTLLPAGPVAAQPPDPPAPCEGCWRPRPTTAPWQWQLQGRVDLSVAARVYEIDGLDQPARVVRALHRRGRRAICYVDVGSWESFRDDAAAFPPETRGEVYEGFEDERWLDIRRIDLLAGPLGARFDACRRKGFDAVEADNVNGFTNPTGFPLTAADQLRFNAWVANEVHRRGMSAALKNDGEQAAELVRWFDFAVVEECFSTAECALYRPFTRARKAVFVAEYHRPAAGPCRLARRYRMSLIFKRSSLGAWRRTCR